MPLWLQILLAAAAVVVLLPLAMGLFVGLVDLFARFLLGWSERNREWRISRLYRNRRCPACGVPPGMKHMDGCQDPGAET